MDTQRTPTPTHRFPMLPGITWTSRSPSLGFTFGRPNPKYPPPDHPDGAGSKTIGRKPIACREVPFFQFFFVRFVPPTYHTHTCTRFLFHSCYHDCPGPRATHWCLRFFDFIFPNSWCNRTWNPASDFLGFTLFCFSGITAIRLFKVRTPRTKASETETRPGLK